MPDHPDRCSRQPWCFSRQCCRCDRYVQGDGAQLCHYPWLPYRDYKTLADWKKLFREFEKYAKALAAEKIVLQYHNHMFEFEKFGIKRDRWHYYHGDAL